MAENNTATLDEQLEQQKGASTNAGTDPASKSKGDQPEGAAEEGARDQHMAIARGLAQGATDQTAGTPTEQPNRGTDSSLSESASHGLSIQDVEAQSQQQSGSQQQADAGSQGSGSQQSESTELAKHAQHILSTFNSHADQFDDDGNYVGNLAQDRLVSDAREKAKEALKRNNWTDELIQSVTDDVLLKQGAKARRTQVEFDRQQGKQQELESELDRVMREKYGIDPEQLRKLASGQQEDGGAEQSQQQQDQGESTAADAAPDVDSIINEAFSDVSDEEDMPSWSDIRKRFSAALGKQQQAQDQRIQQQIQQALSQQSSGQDGSDSADDATDASDPRVDQLTREIEDMRFQQTVDQMGQQIPDLKDRAVAESVKDKARQLSRLPDYQDDAGKANWREAVQDAYRIAYPDKIADRMHREMTDRYRDETEGQPQGEAVTADTSPNSDKGPRDMMEQVGRMLANGENPEKVNQWVLQQRQQGAA